SEKVQHLAPHHLDIERTRKLCAFSRSASTPSDIRAHAYPAQRSDPAHPELPRGTSRPSDQLALRRAQSGHVSKPPPATPTVIQTECACTRRPCPRPSVSVHRTPSAPLGRAPQLSVDRTQPLGSAVAKHPGTLGKKAHRPSSVHAWAAALQQPRRSRAKLHTVQQQEAAAGRHPHESSRGDRGSGAGH
ncbi:MAG: hypothetical protein ACPIOQ_56895, partial [Promethearchaeia archaeon]